MFEDLAQLIEMQSEQIDSIEVGAPQPSVLFVAVAVVVDFGVVFSVLGALADVAGKAARVWL